MVFYFTSRCGDYTIYMGKDKYENEYLIRYGWEDTDVWFHVDDLSSAHVYLRMKPGMKLDDIPDNVLLDCCALVKANSIQGCKKSSVYVVYTRWKNLKKTNSMVDGQVGFHRPENVRRTAVEKNNSIVRQIEKTRQERFPDLAVEQQDHLRALQQEKKKAYKLAAAAKQEHKLQLQREKEARSYDRIMKEENMISTAEVQATADSTAAEEFEEDFM